MFAALGIRRRHLIFIKKYIYLVLFFPFLVSGQEWTASNDNFRASLFLSDKPEEIYSAWNYGEANGVKIEALDSIKAGNPFEAIIVFSGCQPNKKNKCKVVANWEIETFSGVSLGKVDEVPLWLNEKAPAQGQLQIAEKGVGLVADAQDNGYVIRVTVKDLISKLSIKLTQRVKVSDT
ncbi:hypothetical protein [Arenicella xantha]|uniref:Uncharacterized protein n=1 Tax=Arenicella xantha TaxID=644221 RepID=A0A395JEC9_9GAMM|nr:hypothetical protein [Arenicella xantha]RBP44817.1 hypothetical protein DFR28_1261 [Arenicella xantha]